jgi:hypothetical protein
MFARQVLLSVSHRAALNCGDCAYGNSVVVAACRRAGAQFSLVLTKNRSVSAAINSIVDDAWPAVKYPVAVRGPDTGGWISDAEVAETSYTAFGSTDNPVTARLIVRRVKDVRYPDALFPVWRYHPFFTDTDEPVDAADITHRRHAIIETVFANLLDGPLARALGRCGANSAWILCAAIAHNLLRLPASWLEVCMRSPAGPPCADASSPSRPDWPARNADPSCTNPVTGPGHQRAPPCGTTPSATAHPQPSPSDHRRKARPAHTGKLGRPADTRCSQPEKTTKADLEPRYANPSVDLSLIR